jgi:hypothetical protein
VGVQQVRLDERVGGQAALLGVGEEVIQGEKWVANCLDSRGVWIIPVIENGMPGST